MYTNKTVILSGDNKTFNQLFIKRFYSKLKEIRVLTDDIFDTAYDKYEKVKMISNEDISNSDLLGADYIYHFIDEELSKYSKYFSLKENKNIMVATIIKKAISSQIKKAVFISDGSTSLANDKMIKNLVTKNASTLFQKQNKTTSLNYVVAKGYKNIQELLDFTLFATKTGINGDEFVKKTREKITFSQRLKNLLTPQTKIQKDRGSFFASHEISRALDYGQYFKIPLDTENIPYQRFEDRLNSLKINVKELEEA